MKTRIILFLICFLSLHAMGQGTVSRQKCKMCGKVISQCQYKGKHPKPQVEANITQKPKPSKPTTSAVKTCDICGKPLSQCDYGGKHPYCQTCGKLKERCEFRGEHPVCQTCGKLKEQCEFKGEHPVCQTCGKLKEQCEYKGKHPDILAEVMKDMVLVEGGTFIMGATAEQKKPYKYEKPKHQVTLSSFYISKYEVTQSLWKAVMGSNPSEWQGDNLPVENVSWNDCQEFIKKLNAMTGKDFRLPTEAEWEFAARGGNRSQGYQYSGSKNLDDVAWFYDNSYKQTHPVGTKAPNELGIYDMSGNVREWCQDWYGSYSSNVQTNPTGPSSGSYRVIRGGYWDYGAGGCRMAYRDSCTPDYGAGSDGLRLALSTETTSNKEGVVTKKTKTMKNERTPDNSKTDINKEDKSKRQPNIQKKNYKRSRRHYNS
ncbi:MAG: formylglycine-generating enzyme family protein [Bacteroidales bacterium]|nr:formylglycine-generating enzyme family protein [Bacteroidales bacterium]